MGYVLSATIKTIVASLILGAPIGLFATEIPAMWLVAPFVGVAILCWAIISTVQQMFLDYGIAEPRSTAREEDSAEVGTDSAQSS